MTNTVRVTQFIANQAMQVQEIAGENQDWFIHAIASRVYFAFVTGQEIEASDLAIIQELIPTTTTKENSNFTLDS